MINPTSPLPRGFPTATGLLPGIVLLEGDALTRLRAMPDKSVHLGVTSPCYLGQRDYGVAGQMGREPTWAEHLELLLCILDEVWRVLRDDGVLWLNYGDKYASASGWGRGGGSTLDGRKQAEGPQNHGNGGAFGLGLPDKCMLMLPERLRIAMADGSATPLSETRAMKALRRAIELLRMRFEDDNTGVPLSVAEEIGRLEAEHRLLDLERPAPHRRWILRAKPPWVKPNGMPDSASDRPGFSFEDLMLFCKGGLPAGQSGRYFYDPEAVRRTYNPATLARAETAARNGGEAIDHQAPGQAATGVQRVISHPGRSWRMSDPCIDIWREIVGCEHQARLAMNPNGIVRSRA